MIIIKISITVIISIYFLGFKTGGCRDCVFSNDALNDF